MNIRRMNIYVCGNLLVDEDCLPLRIIELLRRNNPNISFIEFDPTEDIPRESILFFIDTVINAVDVMLFNDVDQFVQTKSVSVHDFDLGLNLKLAKKMGWLNKVYIIGVPSKIPEKQAISKINKIIANLFSESVLHS